MFRIISDMRYECLLLEWDLNLPLQAHFVVIELQFFAEALKC